MKVRTKDAQGDKTISGEMVGGSGEMGTVFEMVTDAVKLKDFGFTDEMVARAQSVSTGDDQPEFAVLRVEEGWSGSRRLWPARELDRIVATTNLLEPVGHLGHIPDEQASTAMPDPQTTWIGAIAKTEKSQDKTKAGEMVRVAYFAGYNYPASIAKIRDLIKRRAVRGISWYGKCHLKPVPGQGVEVKDFDLQHLDWARKGAEGMPTARIVAIASEMKGDKMDKDLSQVTPEEFKAENPNGYALLRVEIEREHATVVGEMEAKLTKAEQAEQLLGEVTKALKVDDPAKALEAISSLMTRLGDKAKSTVAALVDQILGEKVTDETNRAYVKGLLVPVVGEMETKVADVATEEDAKKVVTEMIDAQFNENDLIKTLVGEQSAPIIRRREALQAQTGNGVGKDNEYVTERGSRHVGS